MKNRRFIQILGSAILVASLGITGCSIPGAQETTEETTTKETTEETTTEEEEDPCCCVVDEDYDDEEFYSSITFVSSNGELEGQMDYMTEAPDWENMDYSDYPDDPYITDLSVIEDEDIRAVAQSYMDQGYRICDPAVDQEYGGAAGDTEYQFTNGFTASFEDGNYYSYVSVYKMNETLFDFFFVDYNYMNDPEIPVTDDGTVVRYGDEEFDVEFNRETGIGVQFGGWDMTDAVG